MNPLYQTDDQGVCWLSEQGIIELAYSDLLTDSLFEWQDSQTKTQYEAVCRTQDNWPFTPTTDAHVTSRTWFTPPEYVRMSLTEYVLSRCVNTQQEHRARQELALIEHLNVSHIFKHLIYLVDTWRSKNLVWGIGRGSSVSCFILYVIGINKINPLDYDLDPEEFFKITLDSE
jgi:DNA polymerase III alpha subunit